MDKKAIENLISAVKVIRNNQKGQASKILELEAKLNSIGDIESRLARLEEESKGKDKDERFEELDDRIDGIGNVVDSHIDSITKLEENKMDIVKRLGEIDDNIKKINDEILKIEEEKSLKEDNTKQLKVKVCRFNNLGYCKVGKKQCHFYHSEVICEIYTEKGICYRRLCEKRHPRPCRYEEKGTCCMEWLLGYWLDPSHCAFF